MRIQVLKKEIADKIAAGEVVTSPLSVVKELVENSIDAGAGLIVVEIENGGKSYIRITDDGYGISSEDIELAFVPHATSKIISESDLNSIATLGFRGEALSSIAAVSRLEMTTKTADEKMAVRVNIEGGEITDNAPVGAPDGTIITVRDLFYNVPARLKFMKSDRSETTKIVDLISRIAVAYPELKIRLKTNGAALFSTQGNGDRIGAIYTVFGSAAGNDLIEIGAESGDSPLELSGYISGPNHSAKTRKNQFFFVNGRYVKDDVISGAVSEAYREFMFEGRYPFVFLFLHIDPSLVDVNVHPAKSEIKFSDGTSVQSFVKSAIRQALMSKAGVPVARTPRQFASAKRAEREFYKLRDFGDMTNEPDNAGKSSAGIGGQAVIPGTRAPQNMIGNQNGNDDTTAILKDTTEGSRVIFGNAKTNRKHGGNIDGADGEYAEVVNVKNLYGNFDGLRAGELREPGDWLVYEPNNYDDATSETNSIAGADSNGHSELTDQISGHKHDDADIRNPNEGDGAKPGTGGPAQQELRIEYLQVMDTLFGSYIIASDEDSFYLIDFHAAHERVNYELFMESLASDEKLSQEMLVPEVIQLPTTARAYSDEWAAWLTDIGFAAEIFGDGSLILKAVPAFIGAGEALTFAEDILCAAGAPPDNTHAVERLISRACRASVKANTSLKDEECVSLLSALAKCENPYTCPHGRPVFIRYSKYDIDKMFKRV